MKAPRLTDQTFRDAGLLREYVAHHYGQYLAYGGLNGIYWKALRMAKRLSRMTGQSLQQTIDDLVADYHNIYA